MCDKYVCKDCFSDYAIRKFVSDSATEQQCSYCNKESENGPIAAPLEEVVEFILDGIKTEYGDPADEGIGWCSQEGGWQLPIIDTYDLINGELDLGIDSDDLLNDIISSINQTEWCDKNPYSMRKEDALFYSWEIFSEIVKHQTRYVFLKMKDEDKYEESNPYRILEDIGEKIEELTLIKEVNKGTAIFRARIGDQYYNSAKELGAPPVKFATQSNRFSPAGIPMFYGSSDSETAFKELIITDTKKNKITIGKFQTFRNLNLLDLTKLPEVPSIFDPEKNYLRSAAIFIGNFTNDVSKTIEKDSKEHIEYVPTQIVSEYLRHIFKCVNGENLHGMVYPSSKNNGGVNYVLFITNEEATDDEIDKTSDVQTNQNHVLLLERVKHI